MKKKCDLIKIVLFPLFIFSFLFFGGMCEGKGVVGGQGYKSSHTQRSQSLSNKIGKGNKQSRGPSTQQAQIAPAALKHIKDRHWYKANQGSNTSHFNRSMTDQKLTALVLKTVSKGTRSVSKQTQSRLIYQYSFNKPIGTTTAKTKAYSLRVITDSNLNVVTAYPL